MAFNVVYLIKCLLCGFAMCVPGLSGGSMAILLGIYKAMMEIAANFLSKPRKYFFPLLVTGLSCAGGVLLFVIFPGRLTAEYEKAFVLASAVIVGVSLPFYIKNSAIKRINLKAFLYIAAGGIALFLIDLILHFGNSPTDQNFGVFSYFLAGFVNSVSLILPGISYPYMLAFMGIYGKVISAVSGLDFAVLLPLGLGTVSGIILLSRAALKIMEKYPLETDCFLLGFTAFSVILILI
ncbi:MAG: DUF368 domain-containing protein [Clostridiales bacterium]|jgi:putative membrane protein|nr:DUF368 domain-containing protein [Clostridiales bacterium]